MRRHTQTLGDVVGRSFILAYREDVSPLQAALAAEGLNPIVQRARYTDEEMTYARCARTFINHHMAWQRAAQEDGYTLICESDFVPCRGMGGFDVFWPTADPMAWGYLYQGSPRLFAVIGTEAFLRGHCAPLVAYVVNAPVARLFCEFFQDEMGRYDPRKYFTFDAHLQWFAMGRGSSAYITLKHYGEHGGLPNPEHAEAGMPRAGQHRADNLAAPLRFLPQYARGSRWAYAAVRAQSRWLGLARLLANRWFVATREYPASLGARLRMFGIGVRRLCT
ncbi:MAG: hypothetical protein KIT25_14400 [Enhydrobacter sp.]|nr:MAG: hypothetical protein KIT25_14400 [Enhydrobacter sp.]